VVNTASKCGSRRNTRDSKGFTTSIPRTGFTVLGFPSNDFHAQEPGTNQEIVKFCQLHYGVTFPAVDKNT